MVESWPISVCSAIHGFQSVSDRCPRDIVRQVRAGLAPRLAERAAARAVVGKFGTTPNIRPTPTGPPITGFAVQRFHPQRPVTQAVAESAVAWFCDPAGQWPCPQICADTAGREGRAGIECRLRRLQSREVHRPDGPAGSRRSCLVSGRLTKVPARPLTARGSSRPLELLIGAGEMQTAAAER